MTIEDDGYVTVYPALAQPADEVLGTLARVVGRVLDGHLWPMGAVVGVPAFRALTQRFGLTHGNLLVPVEGLTLVVTCDRRIADDDLRVPWLRVAIGIA